MKYIGESGLSKLLTLIKTKIKSLTAFPIGAEITILAGNTRTTKLTAEAEIGVSGNKDGDIISSNGITATIPRYCMIALKKFYA